MSAREVSFLQQRLPFLPLLLCAVAGIVLADQIPFLSTPMWVGLLVTAALAYFLFRKTMAFVVLVVAAFGLVQNWQQRDSSSALFANFVASASPHAEITGLVASEPRTFENGGSSFDLEVRTMKFQNRDYRVPVTIQGNWAGDPPAYGDIVSISGPLKNLLPPRNPGQFDFSAWSARRGVRSQIKMEDESDGQIAATGQGNPLISLANHTRHWMGETLVAGVDDDVVSNLLVGMVLGDVSSMPEAIQEQFRGTGTFHLFSVSGLHVGMLAVLLWYILRTCGISRRRAALIIIPALLFYALMTGWKAASVRSAIMAAIVLMGLMTDRKPVLMNNLCAAAFLILLWDTNQLFNTGFQLSFTVVASLMLLTPPITRFFEKPFQLDPFFPDRLLHPIQRSYLHNGRKLASLTAVSAAAWAGSLPLTVGYFHMVSLSSIPANLLAVPISFLIMTVAMLSLGAGIVSTWAATIYNQTNWMLSHLLIWVIQICASIPGSFFYVRTPELAPPLAEVVVFDFGSGGAAWITAEGKSWMIDCGPERFHDPVLRPFLRSQGLKSLDGLFITHGDAAHIGAATALLASFPPTLVVDTPVTDRSKSRSKLQSLLEETGRPQFEATSRDYLHLGKHTSLHVLYPPGDVPATVADDKAMVIRLDAGATRILFMSDAGTYTEDWLSAYMPEELRCDIMIKGAPSKGSSGSPEFISLVQPDAVITGSADFIGTAALPAEFVNLLRERNIVLFPQDRCGAIHIKIFSTHYEVSAFLNGQHLNRSHASSLQR